MSADAQTRISFTPQVPRPAVQPLSTINLTSNHATIDTNVDTVDSNDYIGTAGWGLIKQGSGATTLTGNNTYNGVTRISGGTLRAGTTTALSPSSRFIVGAGATLNVANNSSISSLEGDGNVIVGADLTITYANNPCGSCDFEFHGAFSGNGNLIFREDSPVRTTVLTGVSTFTGSTFLSHGTLVLGVANALSNSDISLSPDTTLDFHGLAPTIKSLSGTGTVNLNGGSFAIGTNIGGSSYLGTVSGAGSIIKDGDGTFNLSHISNNASVTINRGTLIANAVGQGDLTVNAGGTLQLGSAAASGFGSLNGSGRIVLGNSGLALSHSSFFTGVISGTGGVSLFGDVGDTFTLGGANTYTGPTEVMSGTLRIGAADTLKNSAICLCGASSATIDFGGFSPTFGSLSGDGRILFGSGTLTTGGDGSSSFYSGSLSGTGGLTKVGSGRFELSARSNTLSGTATVSAGTLAAGRPEIFSSFSSIVVNSGGTLDLAGHDQALRSLSGNGAVVLGSALLRISNNENSTFNGVISGTGRVNKFGSGTFTLGGVNAWSSGTTVSEGTLQFGINNAIGGAMTVNSGARLDMNGFTSDFNFFAGNGQVTLGNGGTLGVGRDGSTTTFGGVVSGTGSLIKNGAGTFTLTGANVFAGNTTINAGILRAGAANTFSPASTINVSAGATVDFAGFNQTIGGLAGSGNTTLGGSTMTVGDTTSTTFSGVISGNGNIVKNGSGTLTLAGVNSYLGATTINAGTLKIGATNAISAANTINIGATGTFDLGGFNQQLGGLTGSGVAAVGGATFSLGASNTSTTFSGALTGTGRIFKTGTGTLTLSGTSSFSGLFTVSQGSLALSGRIAGDLLVANGAILINGNSPSAASLSTGARTQAAGGPDVGGNLSLAAGSTYRVAFNASGAAPTLAVGGAAAVDGAALDVSTAVPLTRRISETLVISAAGGLSGTMALRTSGFGTSPAYLTNIGNGLVLTILRTDLPVASVAVTPNGAAFGAAIDRVKTGAVGDLALVTRDLGLLADETLGESLDTLSGEMHASSVQLTALDTDAVNDTIQNQMSVRQSARGEASASVPAWGRGARWWGAFDGQSSDLKSAAANPGSATAGGAVAGVDRAFGRGVIVGAGGAYGRGTLTIDGLEATTKLTAPRGFAYAGAAMGRWTTRAGASLARTSLDTSRHFAFRDTLSPAFGLRPLFDGIDRSATSTQKGLALDAWADAMVSAPLGSWVLQPKAGARLARYRNDSWTEQGADALSLSADAQSIGSEQGELGLRVARAAGSVRPYLSMTYRRELGDNDASMTLRISNGASGQFAVSGLAFAKDTVLGGAGLYALRGRMDLSLDYKLRHSSSETRHSISFGIGF